MTSTTIAKMAASIDAPDLAVLLEALGEFTTLPLVESPTGWQAELYGGTTFQLQRAAGREFSYELRVTTDTSHRLFRNQERTFGRVEGIPQRLTEWLEAVGIKCTWDVDPAQ